MKNSILAALAILVLFSACKEDEEVVNGNFTVTIENIMEGKAYSKAGALDAVPPGQSLTFSFNAGIGSYLSFAQMLAQSNDLFFAPDEGGIALYTDRTALTGDITSLVPLWDAGTEVNMEPGVGMDQAPRQSGPNTGAAENGVVKLIDDVNDGFSYPAASDMIKVELAHDGGTMFTVTITNRSDNTSLTTPLAPGAYVIHPAMTKPLFTEGEASSEGLERMAEDGDNTILSADLTRDAGFVTPFAPGAYAIFQGENPIFTTGALATDALEALAEDGNPAGYTSVFNTPTGASNPAPIFPGESYEFSFDAIDGDQLSFATMFIQSNDLFVAPEAIDLFVNGTAISGDITSDVLLWDAYTEVNEYPGAGNDQAPRQAAANTGTDESANVSLVSDAFSYPTVNAMLRIKITAN